MATFSPLCDVILDITKETDHYRSRNGQKIDKITIHHMAGNLSAETCGRVFLTRQASTNYGIDSNGRVGGYVPEEYGGWSTSNPANDRRAINIELANDGYADTDWHVSDNAINKCIELCVDICKRNGISHLVYDGTINGTLTRHNMFVATTCPGPYLQSKFPYICEEINKRLGQDVPKDGDVFKVNTEDGLWLLDENGNRVEVYPIDTEVEYIADGYYKYGYNYYKVKVLSNEVVGYMASSYLTKTTTPTPEPPVEETIKEGDWVVPVELVDYNGTHLVQYDDKYLVTELVGDRAVCSAPRNGQYVVWAAMNINNLRKVN